MRGIIISVVQKMVHGKFASQKMRLVEIVSIIKKFRSNECVSCNLSVIALGVVVYNVTLVAN